MKRFLRDDGMIKVSRSLKETGHKAYAAKEQLEKQMGREPTLSEIAAAIEVPEEELVEAMDAGAQIESLQQTIYQSEGNSIELMDKLKEGRRQSGDCTGSDCPDGGSRNSECKRA